MNLDEPLEIGGGISIPGTEVEADFSPASGPGGQHVNRTATRVTLRFNLRESPSVPEHDRVWMMERLSSRLTSAGEILLSCEEHRDRLRNLSKAAERLEKLLRAAWTRPKKRRSTRPTRASRERRLQSKRQASERKRQRRRPSSDD